MKKIILVLFSVLLIAAIFLSACQKHITTGDAVASLKETACKAADAAGTCLTKLKDLGIVSAQDCCKDMGKCCGGQ